MGYFYFHSALTSYLHNNIMTPNPNAFIYHKKDLLSENAVKKLLRCGKINFLTFSSDNFFSLAELVAVFGL